MLQESIERIAGCNVVKKGLGHNPGVTEYQRASQNTRIRVNRAAIQCNHTQREHGHRTVARVSPSPVKRPPDAPPKEKGRGANVGRRRTVGEKLARTNTRLFVFPL